MVVTDSKYTVECGAISRQSVENDNLIGVMKYWTSLVSLVKLKLPAAPEVLNVIATILVPNDPRSYVRVKPKELEDVD